MCIIFDGVICSFERTSTVVRSAKETHQNDITDTTSNRTDTT